MVKTTPLFIIALFLSTIFVNMSLAESPQSMGMGVHDFSDDKQEKLPQKEPHLDENNHDDEKKWEKIMRDASFEIPIYWVSGFLTISFVLIVVSIVVFFMLYTK